MQLDDKKSSKHGWNKRDSKKGWGLYLFVGFLCLLLAWLLGGTG